MRFHSLGLSVFFLLAPLQAAPKGCVGSVSVASFKLTVSTQGKPALAIERLNYIPMGYRIAYQPVDLPDTLKNNAKLTLVLVPKGDLSQATVLEPRAASGSTDWSAPFDVGMLLLVFAPQGLDEKRLTNLVTKDDSLIGQLADYADQTTDLEAGIRAVNATEDEQDDSKPLPVSRADQAIFALVRAINPAASTYDPLGAGRKGGPSTMRGKAIDAFFENGGGLVPGGGGAILPGVKTWLLPDTEFRGVYAQPNAGGMALCTQYRQARTHNKVAYLWAHRVGNAGPPNPALAAEVHVPIGLRASLPMKETATDWRLFDHVFDWALISASNLATPVTVQPSFDERVLKVDLRKFPGAPGDYTLRGQWDWSPLNFGVLHLHALDDLKGAKLTPESQAKLVADSGAVTVELEGADFEFVESASLRRAAGTRTRELDLNARAPGSLPKLGMEVDTDTLPPGEYVVALSRADGFTREAPLRVLAAPPRVDNLPLRVNVDGGAQSLTLSGKGLDRLQAVESDGADVKLGPPEPGGERRQITLQLRPGAKAGAQLALGLKLDGLLRPIPMQAAVEVAGPKPRITDAKPSLPQDFSVALRDGELPAGTFVSFALKFEPADAVPVLYLDCAAAPATLNAEKLRVGERHPSARVEASGAGSLFLSLDAGAIGQPGCALTARIETEASGKSDPFPLGKVVRLPRIESLTLSNEKVDPGFAGVLKGQDLETIEKTGWDTQNGIAAPELPKPVAGEGQKQTLKVLVPWPSPSPKAPLYIWLRGETDGRLTKVTP
jgi:hypothetical protein